MIRESIKKTINGNDLSFEEAKELMLEIMEGDVSETLISALLISLKMKGERPSEIAGFISAMREKSVKIQMDTTNLIDVCGTGGDNSGTFNISTAVAFAVSAAGYKVAKHGNRSISSKSGSADVLQHLGIGIDFSPEDSKKAIEEIGISFLFAPQYHPATGHVAPVRRELKMKTIFNILGPLTNPAGTKRQLIGAYNKSVAMKMLEAAKQLEMEKVCFVCTQNAYDEVTLTGNSEVFELKQGNKLSAFSLDHKRLGYPKLSLEELQGGEPEVNANILYELFSNPKPNPHFYVVAANTALALYAAGYSNEINNCKLKAEETILSGKVLDKINKLKEFTKRINEHS